MRVLIPFILLVVVLLAACTPQQINPGPTKETNTADIRECSRISSEEECFQNKNCAGVYIQGLEVETEDGGYSEPDIFQSCGPVQCKKYIVDETGTVAEGKKYRIWCRE